MPEQPKPVRIDASWAIENLEDLIDSVRKRFISAIADKVRAEQQWAGLERCGGARADHAAALLKDVTESLRRLRDHTSLCVKQLETIMADPFGDGQPQRCPEHLHHFENGFCAVCSQPEKKAQ